MPRAPLWVLAALSVFGILYFANALAPEIEADPNTYHLTGHRPKIEPTFYNQLPHATELLFRVLPPKLVSFGFLLLTLPLIGLIAQRLDLPPYAGYAAAVMYFVSPVTGVAGTAAFNDTALVFMTVALVAVLLSDGPAWLAGLLAGLCYGIKMTGGIAIPVGLGFLLARRRWRDAIVFCGVAATVMAPWLVRNVIQTGNPFAPFFNRWFPNPWFHVSTEGQLGANLRSYGVAWWQRFPEVLWGWRLQGIIGPMFLLAPLIMRSRRLLLLLALVLSIPWWLNAGTRFLMPALPLIALGIAAALPKRLAIAAVAAHCVLSWPWVVHAYSPIAWKITSFPWRVAVGLESDEAYLQRVSWEYRFARMIAERTTPEDRILDLHGVHAAYVERNVYGWWQSARGERVVAAIDFARDPALFEIRADLPLKGVRAVRVRQLGAPQSWSIAELELWQRDVRLRARERWALEAWPNPWEVPLVLDRNLASRWVTWERARPGMRVTVDFEGEEQVSRVRVVTTRRDAGSRVAVEVLRETWETLPAVERELPQQPDLRRDVMGLAKRMGFTHIAGVAGYDATGQIAYRFANESDEWGLEVAGHLDAGFVFRIR